MSKKITVKTGDLEETAREFIDIWHQVENGQVLQTPVEKISFKDQRLLFKTLTPRRFDILKHTHEQDGVSIRSLAKELNRDYSNVHQDVKILHQLGLMIKDEKNDKYYVPWDVIVTEIPLPVMKKTKTHRRTANQNTPRVAHG
ncbi:MAG TPA: HTH domain-containing protein [Gammaproteobacteria bacterium]|nr:HTH domain-containing protein [Gammaproteobacteria bacterium]